MGEYSAPVKDFLERLLQYKMIEIEIGNMSTIISGEYQLVMQVITDTMDPLLARYPSVFVLKVSNACTIGG